MTKNENKKTTPGLADIELTQEVLKKRRAKRKKEEWLRTQGKGGQEGTRTSSDSNVTLQGDTPQKEMK